MLLLHFQANAEDYGVSSLGEGAETLRTKTDRFRAGYSVCLLTYCFPRIYCLVCESSQKLGSIGKRHLFNAVIDES